MRIEPGQIYFGPVELKQAIYARPFLVLRVLQSEVVICCLSTKFGLKRPADLTIYASDPSFPFTGLKEESYLVCSSIHAEPLELFKSAKLRGRVEAEIKKRIEHWWGAPLI